MRSIGSSAARLDYDTLACCYLQQTLADVPAEGPYVAAVDGVQIPRHSRTMPGTAWLKCPRTPPWKPGSHRAQFFVHLAALLPRWQGYSRALPLRLDAAFPPKAVPGAAPPQTEGQVGLAQVQWLRAPLDAAGRRTQELLVLGDGHYDTVQVWTHLPARTVLLARTACNRALYELPPVGARRNRRYGARAPRPDAGRTQRRGWQQTTVRVRGRDLPVRYRVQGPYLRRGAPGQPLFLLVVGGSTQAHGRYRRRRKPAFFLVNAVQQDGRWVLPRPVTDLLAWAWQRWEIEVAHREMKSEFGVGEAQCWSATATVRAVQIQAWAYAVCVLAGYRAWGYDRHPPVARPRGLWWRGAPRWSLRTLWRSYQQALGQAPLQHPARAMSRGTWAETEAWLRRMDALAA